MIGFKENRIADLVVEKKTPQPARILRFLWCRRGSALPAVLLVTLVLSLLGTGLLNLALSERQGAATDLKISQAFYLAEAGINLALANLRRDPGWRGGLNNIQLTSWGRINQVTVREKPLSLSLQADAEVGGIRRTIIADVSRPLTSYALMAGNGQGSLWETPLMTIKGDILYLGDLYITLQTLDGNVAASGNLINVFGTIKGNAVAGHNLINYGSIKGKAYYGNSYSGNPSGMGKEMVNLVFPRGVNEPEASYKNGIQLTKEKYTLAELQNIIDSGPGDIKVLYRDGDLVIDRSDLSTYHGKGIIAASGTITLKTNLEADPGSSWALVSGGNFYVGDLWGLLGSFNIQGIIISGGYFSTQFISYLNITGSIVARGVNSYLSLMDITYDPRFNAALSNRLNLGGWQVLSWRTAANY